MCTQIFLQVHTAEIIAERYGKKLIRVLLRPPSKKHENLKKLYMIILKIMKFIDSYR